jgi:hypothetical protein
MRWSSSLLLFVMLFAPAAHAGKKAANQAEVRRLFEDAHKFSQRSAWGGVERAYLQMLGLERKGAELSHDMHLLGAKAAEQRGDVFGAWERLKRAQAVESRMETLTRLATIEATYSRFRIEIHPSYQGEVTLTSLDPLFDPVHRSTLSEAEKTLQENRYLEGLLPLGRYRLAGTVALDSYGGDTQHVVLRANRATVDDPSVISFDIPDLPDEQPSVQVVVREDIDAARWSKLSSSLQQAMLKLEGVDAIQVVPVPERRFYAEYDPATLESLGLAADTIVSAIRQRYELSPDAMQVGPRQVALSVDDVPSLDHLGQTEVPVEDVTLTLNTLVRLREGAASADPAGLRILLTAAADVSRVRSEIATALQADPEFEAAGVVLAERATP